jgi:hypothetical protein
MSVWRPGIVVIGMETSGELRRRFQAAGHETYSIDILPSEDGGEEMAYSVDRLPLGRHLVGDVFETLDALWADDLWPDLAIFHPECTNLTGAAAWAFEDPDFERWPGVGYHQRVKPGTLTGAARREARDLALEQVRRIIALPIRLKAIENPAGAIGTEIMPASQRIQPNQFGDDASKGTLLWLFGLPKLRPTRHAEPRIVDDGRPQLGLFGTGALRWSNQTDAGQNRLSPGDQRWKDRSRTFPGIADAMVKTWAPLIGAAVKGEK